MKKAKISGIGYYVPETVVTNNDLTQRINTTDEWIQERTGIKERRYVQPGQQKNFELGVKAAEKAMEMAQVTAKDIDLIVYATLSPDYLFPGSGVLLQHALGCKHVGAIDVRAQCSGFVYGLSIADQYIKTGMYENILLVGSEIHSTGLDFSDHGRHIAVIFGDGAGAAVIQPAKDGEESGILSTHLHSQGEFAEELATIDPGCTKEVRFKDEMVQPGGSFYPVMNGQFVFKNAILRFEEVINEALEANGLGIQDIDLLVPHQANLRISQMIQKKLALPNEKVMNTIQKYGNTTAASIPISLSEAYQAGRVKPGDLVCLAAFGSGFTWASALVRW
ncbi:beta-ketoacyl-ACP synthase III [Rapidithrix thailandica]|uniref:Beta-ketoacyl-[acyl-carrier-protein] synthase III n=1 Tax=Rapidithrix thailandica TaxID=413964 RepID=A0AAW9S7R0_9BACT